MSRYGVCVTILPRLDLNPVRLSEFNPLFQKGCVRLFFLLLLLLLSSLHSHCAPPPTTSSSTSSLLLSFCLPAVFSLCRLQPSIRGLREESHPTASWNESPPPRFPSDHRLLLLLYLLLSALFCPIFLSLSPLRCPPRQMR